ncbi:hypothetical protein Trydic_g593 [Trypoxylus dichotomus]
MVPLTPEVPLEQILTADTTQIHENLIRRLEIILKIINSNSSLDSHKFHLPTRDTAKVAIQLYPWYYMPSTVRKILIHGAEIITAQDSRHKDYTRKCSRTVTNEDVFHKMLESSDPYITQP